MAKFKKKNIHFDIAFATLNGILKKVFFSSLACPANDLTKRNDRKWMARLEIKTLTVEPPWMNETITSAGNRQQRHKKREN